MSSPDKSFRLDREAPSFRVRGLTLRTLPYLLVAFVLVTLVNLAVGWLPERFLPERWKLVPLALMIGFVLGLLFLRWVKGPPPPTQYELSPEAQALARDPSQRIAAIQRFREEHPDVSLSQAKERVERFCRTGQ
jgi:hypothetical protein